MGKPAVHQFSANLSFGDAISNDMMEIQTSLMKMGYDSKIYAQYMDPRMAKDFNLFTAYQGNPENIILFHASIGGDVFDWVKKLPDKKILIYHNMTPSHFFEGYNDHLANLLAQGPDKVKELKSHFAFAVGDSDFNRRDLVKLEFPEEKTDTLPIFVDFQKYDKPINRSLEGRLKAGDIKNILFVGRFAPNKCHADLIKSFYVYHRHFNPQSRLILIGNHDGLEAYYLQLKKLVEMLDLKPHVMFGDQVSFEDLATYYKVADLFISMSEHEGFLVPILECFHLGIPILAYRAGAVPETMGHGGVVFDVKNHDEVAEKMDQIIMNFAMKTEIVRKQKERIKDFSRDRIEKKLQEVINHVL